MSVMVHLGGGGSGLPPPDLLYRISNIHSVEHTLPNNYLKSPPKKFAVNADNSKVCFIDTLALYSPMLIKSELIAKKSNLLKK